MNNNTERIAALTGLGARYDDATAGNARMTLPEKIAALEQTVIRLDDDLTTANKKVTDLEAKEQDIDTRAHNKAVEIMASVGVTVPVKADANKTAGKDNPNPTEGLSGVQAVIARYKVSGRYDSNRAGSRS